MCLFFSLQAVLRAIAGFANGTKELDTVILSDESDVIESGANLSARAVCTLGCRWLGFS